LFPRILSDKSSHLRCWRLRSADQLPTGLVLSGAPGPHLQVQAASRLKLKTGTHNNRGIDKSKTNNTSNTLIVLSKTDQESPSAFTRITHLLTKLSHRFDLYAAFIRLKYYIFSAKLGKTDNNVLFLPWYYLTINFVLLMAIQINGEISYFFYAVIDSYCERKSQCCRQIERLGVQSYVMKVLSSICSVQPANTVNMPLRSS
jgi:hypothetical protein